MEAGRRRASPVGTLRLLAVMAAIAGVAVLHGVQCATGMAAPLLAPPAAVHAVQDRILDVATASIAAEIRPAPAASALGELATVEGRAHRNLPDGVGAAAGACLMVLTAMAGLLSASLPPQPQPRPDSITGAARTWRLRLPPAPRLDLLCVSRT